MGVSVGTEVEVVVGEKVLEGIGVREAVAVVKI